jgi:hypothetical protein
MRISIAALEPIARALCDLRQEDPDMHVPVAGSADGYEPLWISLVPEIRNYIEIKAVVDSNATAALVTPQQLTASQRLVLDVLTHVSLHPHAQDTPGNKVREAINTLFEPQLVQDALDLFTKGTLRNG